MSLTNSAFLYRANRPFLFMLLFLALPMASAGPLACTTLKAAIDAKIHSHGVRQYSLDVVDFGVATVGKVVGRCEGGTQKIIYTKGDRPLPTDHSAPSPSKATSQGGRTAAVDARGFIDVWALRKAVLRVASMPTGDYECNGYGGGGEDEAPHFKSRGARLAYERQPRLQEQREQREMTSCERAREKVANTFKDARNALNRQWMPVLVRATALGDPVAEVVLRLCKTAPMLDRVGISADCSKNPAEQSIARHRLEAIGFRPALHNLTDKEAAYRESQQHCSTEQSEARRECRLRADAERYERILSVMKTGHVGVAETWNTCQTKSDDPHLDKLVEECQRLQNLMVAVSGIVSKFYTAGPLGNSSGLEATWLSLARPILSGEPGKSPYAEIYESRGIVERHDRSKFSAPDFQATFYADVDKAIQTIEANIDEDLHKDPRWGVFLIERITGRFYDAMNTDDPNRPSAAAIEAYETQTPRAKAAKAAAEEARWRSADTQHLIASLHESRNTSLYYSREQFPLNLKELERRDGVIPALVSAYHADRDNDLFRFNLIMVLALKMKYGPHGEEERELARKCLADGLGDVHPWVRTEAAFGLGFAKDKQYCGALKLLFDDDDKWVASEARQSASRLGCN